MSGSVRVSVSGNSESERKCEGECERKCEGECERRCECEGEGKRSGGGIYKYV